METMIPIVLLVVVFNVFKTSLTIVPIINPIAIPIAIKGVATSIP